MVLNPPPLIGNIDSVQYTLKFNSCLHSGSLYPLQSQDFLTLCLIAATFVRVVSKDFKLKSCYMFCHLFQNIAFSLITAKLKFDLWPCQRRQDKIFYTAVPHNALYQNFTNGSTPPKRLPEL